MGMITYRQKISSTVAPSRLFKAFILDSHDVLPKIVPEWIKSVELIEGDGGVGSVKKTNFGESSNIKYAKHKIHTLDVGSFCCRYTMIKSDFMVDQIDFVEKVVKFVAADKGCDCKMVIEYHVKKRGDVTQAEINRDKGRALGFFKAVEKYLLANPHVCS